MEAEVRPALSMEDLKIYYSSKIRATSQPNLVQSVHDEILQGDVHWVPTHPNVATVMIASRHWPRR